MHHKNTIYTWLIIFGFYKWLVNCKTIFNYVWTHEDCCICHDCGGDRCSLVIDSYGLTSCCDGLDDLETLGCLVDLLCNLCWMNLILVCPQWTPVSFCNQIPWLSFLLTFFYRLRLYKDARFPTAKDPWIGLLHRWV